MTVLVRKTAKHEPATDGYESAVGHSPGLRDTSVPRRPAERFLNQTQRPAPLRGLSRIPCGLLSTSPPHVVDAVI